MIPPKVRRAGGKILQGMGRAAVLSYFIFTGSSLLQADELPPEALKTPTADFQTQENFPSEEESFVRKEVSNPGDSFEIDEDLRLELEKLQKELLSIPKRRRYRYGHDGEMIFDSN